MCIVNVRGACVCVAVAAAVVILLLCVILRRRAGEVTGWRWPAALDANGKRKPRADMRDSPKDTLGDDYHHGCWRRTALTRTASKASPKERAQEHQKAKENRAVASWLVGLRGYGSVGGRVWWWWGLLT